MTTIRILPQKIKIIEDKPLIDGIFDFLTDQEQINIKEMSKKFNISEEFVKKIIESYFEGYFLSIS